uniref:Uncharacterized protein n=1 Tax=Vitis vinifera TaxID=29760 RepID=F6GZT7_VITVI
MLDPRTELSANRAVAGINDSYGSWGSMRFGGRPQRSARNHENYGAWNGGDWQFGAEAKVEDESGVCSPPLWKTSPSGSPNGGNSPLHRRHHQNHYRSLSPASRMQAIAQGQRELMEMVRNMPESCYELSLKDLVERPVVQAPQDPFPEKRNFGDEIATSREKKKVKDRKKKNDTKPKMGRSGSLDNGGFLLKMVFPVSFRLKKKKNSATNTCSKVSPKPLASDGSAKSVDKEWWKKKVTVSGESDGGGTTSNSGSSGSSSSSSICSNRSSSIGDS